MSDSMLFFLLLVALTGALMAFVFWQPEKLYEYPFFMGAVFLSFIVPQAYSLVRFPGGATDDSIAATLLMSCLSLVMCCVGYMLGGRHGVSQKLGVPVNRERLAYGGLLFAGIGWVFTWLILQMSEEETGGSMWTGRVTIYAFFAQLIYPAFSILLRTAIETRSSVWWAGVVFAALPALYATIFGGRREPTVLFLLTIALTLFFYRRVRLQRWMASAAILFTATAIPATGIYRQIAAEGEWQLLKQFSLSDNFRNWLSEEQRVLELRNAATIIESVADTRDYHFGVGYWDELVWRFVPAQWFGNEFKQSLMFRRFDENLEQDLFSRAYETSVGSTITGIGDSFREFGYFGCLFFAVVGMFFRHLWNAATERDSVIAQVFYIQISTTAMRALTHQTVDFLPGTIYSAIFIGLLALFARHRRGLAGQLEEDHSERGRLPERNCSPDGRTTIFPRR